MLKILINAYACSPNMGSEPGMAWNWCINLAKHCELHIITEGEFKDKIEQVLPTIPQSKNMYFYYNEISPEIRRMCWNQGDWRFYYHYKKWQKKTLKIATNITKNHKIHIIHQLNMIGFREPGYLWKIKDIPFVWGPINAKESFPTNYLQGANFKNKLFIRIKNFLNYIQLKTSVRVRRAINHSKYVFAASSDSAKSLEKFFNIKPITINESGCEVDKNNIFVEKSYKNEKFKLLWVGRFIFSKQLNIAIKTLSLLDKNNYELHIIGGNPQEEKEYKILAKKLNVENNIVWHGKIPHEKVQEIMCQSDIFFFTSIFEGTPHVVLESLANNLPILCFDTCGQADCVNEKVGVKIKLTNPTQSSVDFAEKISELYNNSDLLNYYIRNCKERQNELSWDSKVDSMIKIYNKIV